MQGPKLIEAQDAIAVEVDCREDVCNVLKLENNDRVIQMFCVACLVHLRTCWPKHPGSYTVKQYLYDQIGLPPPAPRQEQKI